MLMQKQRLGHLRLLAGLHLYCTLNKKMYNANSGKAKTKKTRGLFLAFYLNKRWFAGAS